LFPLLLLLFRCRRPFDMRLLPFLPDEFDVLRSLFAAKSNTSR
jgi:hypothetical protein